MWFLGNDTNYTLYIFKRRDINGISKTIILYREFSR
uniref:Uncharacterized protein n=1 Tax=Staphylococcus phage 184DA TaxID=3110532 RepID=A0AAU6MXG1_9CAUD